MSLNSFVIFRFLDIVPKIKKRGKHQRQKCRKKFHLMLKKIQFFKLRFRNHFLDLYLNFLFGKFLNYFTKIDYYFITEYY